MDWNMVGALAEFVGALAVIVTLFYLSSQVREASKETQRERWSDLNHQVSTVSESWFNNAEFSDLMYRGLTDRGDPLIPTENFRFFSNLYRMFRAWEAVYEYSQENGIVTWGVVGFKNNISDTLGFPGVRRYWQNRKHWYSESFQLEIDKILSEASPKIMKAYDSVKNV